MQTLKVFWSGWKRVGRFIGDLIGRLVLTVLYFTVVLPFGVGVRLGSDPLQLKKTLSSSYWLKRKTGDLKLADARHQF